MTSQPLPIFKKGNQCPGAGFAKSPYDNASPKYS